MKFITHVKLSLFTATAVGAMTLQPVTAQMANNSGSNTSNNAAFDVDGRDQSRSSDAYNSRGQNSSSNSSMSGSNYSRDRQGSNSSMNNNMNNTNTGNAGTNRSPGNNPMGNTSGIGRDNLPQRSGRIHNAIINQQGILTYAQHVKSIANTSPVDPAQPVVTLRGSVVTENEKILIYSIVKRLARKNDIRNEIEVRATDS